MSEASRPVESSRGRSKCRGLGGSHIEKLAARTRLLSLIEKPSTLLFARHAVPSCVCARIRRRSCWSPHRQGRCASKLHVNSRSCRDGSTLSWTENAYGSSTDDMFHARPGTSESQVRPGLCRGARPYSRQVHEIGARGFYPCGMRKFTRRDRPCVLCGAPSVEDRHVQRIEEPGPWHVYKVVPEIRCGNPDCRNYYERRDARAI
jgi:hypothetical protein